VRITQSGDAKVRGKRGLPPHGAKKRTHLGIGRNKKTWDNMEIFSGPSPSNALRPGKEGEEKKDFETDGSGKKLAPNGQEIGGSNGETARKVGGGGGGGGGDGERWRGPEGDEWKGASGGGIRKRTVID